jgi:hypothetical protein
MKNGMFTAAICKKLRPLSCDLLFSAWDATEPDSDG